MAAGTESVKRVGLIGLGAMGLQMARHLVAKGFEVAGYDIDAAAMRRAEGHGVRLCASPEAVGQASEVVIIMVQTDAQVEELIARSGLLPALGKGGIICVASSISADLCRSLAARAEAQGVGLLDTPVVLGQEAADKGTLTTYVGGGEEYLARARPVLAAFCGSVLYLGGAGNGQIAKTMNNLLLWACMTANFEVLTLAKRLGADIPRLVAALGSGSGANWSLGRWGKSTGKWSEKDMDVALELAQEAKVPMPLSGLVDQLVKSLNQEKMKALLS
jgi:3-hydroxyisobutyrate dehydrogenase-like beta-hydroxyacid dehydrogenase